jgi:serine protease Do
MCFSKAIIISCVLAIISPQIAKSSPLSSQSLHACPMSAETTSALPSIIQTAMKATVSVETFISDDTGTGDAEPNRLGSGAIISADGLFLTNAHVVGNQTQFTVRLFDGTIKRASLVGLDRLVDIAVVKIEHGEEPIEKLAFFRLKLDQRSLIGEPVVALGYPMSFGLSATRGIVSGFDRAYDNVWPVDFLQHDAALNPGNSGGPLIDARGCLIGINTATPVETQFDIGVGLAIPAELISEIAPQLITAGTFSRGQLGVYVSRASRAMARILGANQAYGVIIDDIDPTKTAALAGLRPGDLITHLDDIPIRQVRDMTQYLLRRREGEGVQVRLVRAGQTNEIRVALGGAPQLTERLLLTEQAERTQPIDLSSLGFELSSTPSTATIQDVKNDSIADLAGLQSGNVIFALNGNPIGTAQEARARLSALLNARSSQIIVLRIGRSNRAK